MVGPVPLLTPLQAAVQLARRAALAVVRDRNHTHNRTEQEQCRRLPSSARAPGNGKQSSLFVLLRADMRNDAP